MNFAESAALEQLLRERGWEVAEDIQHCNLLIVNTCSVRITAETRVFGRLGLFSAMKKKRNFTIVLMGCMAQRLHDEIKEKFPLLDYVVGMFERDQFTAIFDAVERETLWEGTKEGVAELTALNPQSSNEQRYHFSKCSFRL